MISPIKKLREEKRRSVTYLCNQCLRKIGGWATLDYDDMVLFPNIGVRFHRKCWRQVPHAQKRAIVRREGRAK
jgi:hypothetical protein